MKKLWIILAAVFIFSFGILGWIGTEIFRQAPPIPSQVVSADGTVVIGPEQISDGQNVWQAMGGMQVGSIWGHGSYVAPDWTADYLHRECIFILNTMVERPNSVPTTICISSEQKASLRQRLQDLMRTNTYDASTGEITIDPLRAKAFEENLKHYTDVFTNGKHGVRDTARCAVRSRSSFGR